MGIKVTCNPLIGVTTTVSTTGLVCYPEGDENDSFISVRRTANVSELKELIFKR